MYSRQHLIELRKTKLLFICLGEVSEIISKGLTPIFKSKPPFLINFPFYENFWNHPPPSSNIKNVHTICQITCQNSFEKAKWSCLLIIEKKNSKWTENTQNV